MSPYMYIFTFGGISFLTFSKWTIYSHFVNLRTKCSRCTLTSKVHSFLHHYKTSMGMVWTCHLFMQIQFIFHVKHAIIKNLPERSITLAIKGTFGFHAFMADVVLSLVLYAWDFSDSWQLQDISHNDFKILTL